MSSDDLYTDRKQTSFHTCLPSTASMHMPHVTSNFIFFAVWTTCPLRAYYRIPTFISSDPLTGRTDRLHIFQTIVASHRAQQVFI